MAKIIKYSYYVLVESRLLEVVRHLIQFLDNSIFSAETEEHNITETRNGVRVVDPRLISGRSPPKHRSGCPAGL